MSGDIEIGFEPVRWGMAVSGLEAAAMAVLEQAEGGRGLSAHSRDLVCCLRVEMGGIACTIRSIQGVGGREQVQQHGDDDGGDASNGDGDGGKDEERDAELHHSTRIPVHGITRHA